MTRSAGAVARATSRAIFAREASVVPMMSVGPESSCACDVDATSVNATARASGVGLTAPPLPARPPHDTSRTTASAALDAERQAIGEHLRKAARVDTSLCLIYSVRRTIEGDGSRVGVEHRVRRARVAVARLADAAG